MLPISSVNGFYFLCSILIGIGILIQPCQCQSNDYCYPKYLSCPCGTTTDQIVIALKQCNSQNQCQSCDGISDTERCSYFNNCTMCSTDPIDCNNCPNGKFSGRYRKQCSWRIYNNQKRREECSCYSTYTANLGFVSISSLSITRPVNTCPQPMDPANGIAESKVDISQPGDVVYYRCNEGFSLVGPATRLCQENLIWSGTYPRCVKFCIWPPGWRPARGNSEIVRENFSVTLSCWEGYTLVGTSQITCMSGGEWSTEFPTCVPTKTADNPTSGQEDTTINKEDYSTVPPPVETTRAPDLPPSTTQAPTIDITPKSNSNPGMIQSNLNQTGTSCKAGAILTYSCAHPFEVDGPTMQQCLPNGQWPQEKPKCKLICGKGTEPKSPQIVGGSIAKINGYPWQVALTSYSSKSEFRYIYCGGVLISEKWVLTAAHCITEDRSQKLLDEATLLLFFAKHFTDRNIDNNDVISRKVSRLVLNPNYDPFTFDSDLGLILVNEDLQISSIVMPLCLPRENSMTTFEDGRKGLVAGWGNIDNKDTAPTTLMMLELPIVNNQKCEESYRQHNFKTIVTDNMFCAGVDEGGKNTCHGDSGGAMAFYENNHYILEGIVSWGNKDDCAAPGFYGGFVRVRNFLPWIKAFIPVP